MKPAGNKAWQDLDDKHMDQTELWCEACTTRRKCFDCQESEKYTKNNMLVLKRSEAELKNKKKVHRNCQVCSCRIDETKSYFFCEKHMPENENVNMIFRRFKQDSDDEL